MKLDHTLVHLSPLVNFYKGRDYFSAFVFYSANLKDLTDLTKASRFALAVGLPPSAFIRTATASTSCDAVIFVRFVRSV